MTRIKKLWRSKNLWIAFVLLLANGLAWSVVGRQELVQVDPILHPHLAEIRTHWQAGDAVGETFQVVITEQEAAETIAWFISGRASVPFTHPQIEIHPDRIVGGGLAHVAGLQTYVYGKGNISIVNGKPFVTVLGLGVASASIPGFVLSALQTQVEEVLAYYSNRPIAVELTKIELREGEMLVEGIYR